MRPTLWCAAAKRRRGVDRKRFFFLVSLFDQSYWIIGSVLGALVGSLLTFDTTGIDFCHDGPVRGRVYGTVEKLPQSLKRSDREWELPWPVCWCLGRIPLLFRLWL